MFVPGSWPPKLLAGKARTRRPLSLYFAYSFSSEAYWGVRPHFEAVLTTRMTLPLYFDRGTSLPLMFFIVKERTPLPVGSAPAGSGRAARKASAATAAASPRTISEWFIQTA